MNKKFLSAILFGAMLATSAGTFVSCKDYDDDIKGLQTQIDTNKTAIAELQKLVGAGNWVTNVAASGENLVVTMSNGTTATIAGIKGADGKDGKDAAEWTISEDGFWCKDGEKTTNVAVAQNGKDGKDGATAPSPTISDNGMWVVYSWDAAKGEFVAEETEIPAAGTSAYAVKADGVYTLYIADENGEMQEITLPATSDSFVVEAPYKHVDVKYEVSTWTKWAAAAKTDEGKALLAKYPELAEIAKNAPMKQGGMLPLIVTPAAVELSDAYSFSLQNVDGSVADIELSAPVKGADLEWDKFQDKLNSRSAAEACMWSLSMEPAYDKKKYSAPYYASTTGKASLVAENEKGTVVRTAFAYTVAPQTITRDVTISGNVGAQVDAEDNHLACTSEAPFAEAIDLFAPFYKDGVLKNAPISFANDYKNHYVIAVANALQAERYGLSIAEDGHTLNIAKMPTADLSITVDLTVVALGLNGSVSSCTVKLTIGQEIVVSEGLSAVDVTLAEKDQKVTWKFEELGLSAVAFENFYKNNTITLTATREADKNNDGDTEKYVAYSGNITFYNAKGAATNYTTGTGAWSNGAPEAFGFTLKSAGNEPELTGYTAEGWTEDVYNVTLKSVTSDGNTVVYAVGTELTVKNPELTADYVKLVPAFVEDDVFQITGLYSSENIEYNLEEALIANNGATVKSFIDYDNYLYAEEGGENAEEYAFYKWVNPDAEDETDDNMLIVNKWENEPEEYTVDWFAAENQQLYQVRNIRAMIALFNDDNLVPFDFQVIVKSEIYSEDASSVTVDATKLKAKFADDGNTDAKENQIDLSKAITAKVVAGFDKDKAYNLFAKRGTSTTVNTTTYDYTDYQSAGDYVLDDNGALIPLSIANYDKLCDLLNVTPDVNIINGEKVYNLPITRWVQMYTAKLKYYSNGNLSAIYTKSNIKKRNNDWTVVRDDKNKAVYEETSIVRWFKVKYNESLSKYEFVKDDNGDPIRMSGNVFTALYEANETVNAALVQRSGATDMTENEAAALEALTVIPEEDATWIELFDAYREAVSAKSTTASKPGANSGTADRDERIVSVKFAFDNVDEASKFFTNESTEGYVFTDVCAEDAILIAKETAAVDVTGGKVVVAMKAYIKDAWGMTMVVPFNVELATK